MRDDLIGRACPMTSLPSTRKGVALGFLPKVRWCIGNRMHMLAPDTMTNYKSKRPWVRNRIGSQRRFGITGQPIGPLSRFTGSVLLPPGIDVARLVGRDQDLHSILGIRFIWLNESGGW
ncbi:conserved hypothetical protein [Ricinus communis]|uniref:Uncharacterized protein n=1 Tax=Ricinus communis TaxID=3988 RepID=B9RQ08_RICCO|nr:conserved hypothetical protein [Ricinus communis]